MIKSCLYCKHFRVSQDQWDGDIYLECRPSSTFFVDFSFDLESEVTLRKELSIAENCGDYLEVVDDKV